MKSLITSVVPPLILFMSFPVLSETIVKRTSDEVFGVTSNYLLAEDAKGNRTKFRIEYFGHAKGKMWQTGNNSEPLKGDFVDNRRCDWDIEGTIQRRVVMESAIGAEGEYKELAKIYRQEDVGGVGPDNWFENLTYARPCTGKEERDYENRFNDFKAKLMKEVPDIKDAERESLIKELKQTFKVSKVSEIQAIE